MKIVLFSFLLINFLDLWLMPCLTAMCRSGIAMERESTWIPFSHIYKIFIIIEFCLISLSGEMNQSQMILIIILVGPFLIDLVALIMAVFGRGTYTINGPWNGTLDDILRLKEHRFYPVHDMDHKFFTYGIMDNASRYLASLTMAAAIVKILLFL